MVLGEVIVRYLEIPSKSIIMNLGLTTDSEIMLGVVTIVVFAVLVTISFGSLMWVIKTLRGK
jgi:hypothetical protein